MECDPRQERTEFRSWLGAPPLGVGVQGDHENQRPNLRCAARDDPTLNKVGCARRSPARPDVRCECLVLRKRFSIALAFALFAGFGTRAGAVPAPGRTRHTRSRGTLERASEFPASDAAKTRDGYRLFGFAGNADLLRESRNSPGGHLAATPADLTHALAALGVSGKREASFTYTVDTRGILRLADLRSEHVDCASGEPVTAAGEVTLLLTRTGCEAIEANNRSTGYCPEPVLSWAPFAAALARAGIAGPSFFTETHHFRVCETCNILNAISPHKAWVCPGCGHDLPKEWNPDRPARIAVKDR